MSGRSLNARLPLAWRSVRSDSDVAHMILHDTEAGQLRGEFCHNGWRVRPTIHIQRQIIFGQQLQVIQCVFGQQLFD